jgi:Ca2+:H+ antiporter
MGGLESGVNAGHEKPTRTSFQGSRDPALPHARQDIPDDNVNGTAAEGQQPGGLVRIKSAGESGRRGFHPLHFIKIIWASSSRLSRAVNILWPFVPAALAVYYTNTGSPTLRFALSYVAMVPCANLIGFAGQELARKMPHMLGVLTETTCVL